MDLAIAFTNFGPYHLARLRALGARLSDDGGRLIAHEMASCERKYPWGVARGAEPFDWITLFPDRAIEDISASECAQAMTSALDRDQPDAVAVTGYVRPESMAALRWAETHDRPAVLLSESQECDAPRTWWKEAIKRRRVRRFSSALVGGPRHRDYLMKLGMPADRVALGYNAVDHGAFRSLAETARSRGDRCLIGTDRDYFLSVGRFAPEKNLIRLIHAFAAYRADAEPDRAWDLVLCGDGPMASEIDGLVRHLGLKAWVHRPGFLQGRELATLYAFASGFILPSRVEPWGLVANEAAACAVPLLISDRCGCAGTLVTDRTGRRFDPDDVEAMASSMASLAGLPPEERAGIGREAEKTAAAWGPDRFASGMFEALASAQAGPVRQRVAEASR